MKKLLTLSTAAMALLSFAGIASAQIIVSDQFTVYSDHHITSGLAGVVAAGNWNLTGTDPQNNANNHVVQNIVQTGLVNSNNVATSIGLNLTFDATYQGNSSISDGTDTTNDNNLIYPVYFNRYTDDTPSPIPDLSLQITGLNTGDNYNLYVYVNEAQFASNLQNSSITLVGGPTYSVTTDTTLTNFTQITGTNATGNYVEYTGLTGATSETVTVATGLVGITGFQLVDTGAAVPEPSTYALLLVGLGVLAFGLRRRKVAL